jgi:hypothetical protein
MVLFFFAKMIKIEMKKKYIFDVIFKRMSESIESTFTFIAQIWTEECYKDQASTWENVLKMIITDPDPTIQSVTCKGCGTR